MSNKKIMLTELNNKETFVYLYERVVSIEGIIQQIQNIRHLHVDIINTLEQQGISYLNMIRTYTELTYILYRSMFQAASWEDPVRREIKPEAYGFDNHKMNIHNEICSHVNEVLAHQDIVNAQTRGVYSPILNEKEENAYMTWNQIKVHAEYLIPNIHLMKECIQSTYISKFGEKLNLFP